jgi:folate-dependent phosphoribosylglycinamide formyltransferase PurN
MAWGVRNSTDRTLRNRICVVTAGGPYPWIIVNALTDRFGPVAVIREQPEPMGAFLRRRARREGWVSVAGQFLTMAVAKLGKKLIARRIAAIEAEDGLEPAPRAGQRIVEVSSVNDPAFLGAVEEIAPDVILLAGCRMMKRDVLAGLACPVLNYHAGITPAYRGMNGGYWALATGDAANFGATVHVVDAGVDTGGIVRQVRGAPAPGDSLLTYAHRLAALARPICVEAVEEALEGRLAPRMPEGESRQWFTPPVWRYVWTGVRRGVW